MEGLRIALLDGFSVSLNGKDITSFGTRKAQALLAYLVVESARPHRRDFLAGLLWGEQPQEKALHSLRQAVSALRRVLTDGSTTQPYLLAGADAVQFNPRSPYKLDVDTFANMYRQGMPIPGQRLNPGRLCQAAELYRHPFLDQFFLKDDGSFEEWAVLKREVYGRQMNDILLKLCRFYERRREYTSARHYAGRLMRLAPWSEQAHLILMRLYVLEGDVAAAEQQFFICRQMCRQFEMEPSPALSNLYEMIHAGQLQAIEEQSVIPEQLTGSSDVYPVPLVGREREMAELSDILSNPLNRLITIHGVGGVGKTRLALELAHSQVGIFRDGVYFIGLAALTNRDQLPALVARSLGLELSENQEPGRQVLSFLRKKELLLVLDNFDTLLQYKKLLLDWLQGAPDIVILLTSRERLKLALELVYSLEGLRCTDDGCSAENAPAERLFLEHGNRLGMRGELRAQELQALQDICCQVEGLPLALELAAAALWSHSLPEIAAAIRQNMDAISVTYQDVAPRHRSLWATFEYSTRLLSDEQLELFQRLAVFPADFSGRAVEQICAARQDTLLALVDKSMVRNSGAGRYSMHRLTRQYACQELRMNVPLYEENRRAFIDYYYRYVMAQDAAAINSSLSQAIRAIEDELPAILKACRWMAETDIDRLYDLLPSLCVFYSTQSRYSEALAFLNQMLALNHDQPDGRALHIRLYIYSGVFYQQLNCSDQASQILKQYLEEAARLGMIEEQVMCLIHLAYCSQQCGNLPDAHRLAEQALEISCRHGIVWAEAESYYACGRLAYRQGNTVQASAYLEKSLEMGRRYNAPLVIMPALNLLADVACHRGEYLKGEKMFKECLSLSQELNSRYHQAVNLNNLGTIYQLQGDYDRAGMLYEQSLEKCISIGAGTREGIVRSNLGEIAMLRGDDELAEVCYRQAYDIGCDIHDSYLMVVSLNNLAEIARRQKFPQKALDWLQQSIHISNRARLYPKLLIAFYTAACVLLDQGRRKDACALLELVAQHPSAEQDTRSLASGRLLQVDGVESSEVVLSLEDAVQMLVG